MQVVGKDPTTNVSIGKNSLTVHPENNPVKVLPIKKAYKKSIFKRLSPFLLLAFIMPLLFVYSLLMQKIDAGDVLIHLLLLLFLEINVLFADFALWNYYHYRRVAGIWIGEGLIACAIIYLWLNVFS